MRPRGLWFCVSFAEASANKLTSSACCLVESCNLSNSDACFCDVTSRNSLAADTDSFNAPRGALILSITFSIITSVTVVAISLSAWSRRRKATKRIMELASAGSLKDKVAERSISASFNLEFSSEGSNHPLFSSQDRASLAKVTRLGDAVICASMSAWVEKFQGLCADVLLGLTLDLQEAFWGPVFGLAESPMALKWPGAYSGELGERGGRGNKESAGRREGALPLEKKKKRMQLGQIQLRTLEGCQLVRSQEVSKLQY